MNVREILEAFARYPQLQGYLAPAGFEQQTANDVPGALGNFGRLILAPGQPVVSAWAQNTWHNVKLARVESIKAASRLLAGIQRNWWPYEAVHSRRMQLVQAQLPHVSAKEHDFPADIPRSPLGSWTMVDPGVILYSPECSSQLPNGEMRFRENHTDPPSRAYLKLWEALSLVSRRPGPGDRCLDLGASPGGWTWVLRKLGSRVTAVDRSPLVPSLMNDPLVEFREGSAFACQPSEFEHVDWLFSDVICYPDRLYEFVTRWVKSGKCQNYVCTIKFQSGEHYHFVKMFQEIAGGRVVHLSHNKHELTWIRVQN